MCDVIRKVAPFVLSKLWILVTDWSMHWSCDTFHIKLRLYQKLFWPFTVWLNCSSDLNFSANSRSPASNFKSFPWSLEQFFLTEGQNDFGNKMPFQKCYHFRMEEFKFREKSMKSFMDSPFQLLYSLGTLISAAPHFLTRKRKKA